MKLNNKILLISVVENPLIENIVYKGLKAEKIKSKITTNLKLKSRSSYNEFELKKDKLMMLSNLKELGYNFSTVDVFIKNLNDNNIEIIYDITLGKKANLILTKPIQSLTALPYSFGSNLIEKVYVNGKALNK